MDATGVVGSGSAAGVTTSSRAMNAPAPSTDEEIKVKDEGTKAEESAKKCSWLSKFCCCKKEKKEGDKQSESLQASSVSHKKDEMSAVSTSGSKRCCCLSDDDYQTAKTSVGTLAYEKLSDMMYNHSDSSLPVRIVCHAAVIVGSVAIIALTVIETIVREALALLALVAMELVPSNAGISNRLNSIYTNCKGSFIEGTKLTVSAFESILKSLTLISHNKMVGVNRFENNHRILGNLLKS